MRDAVPSSAVKRELAKPGILAFALCAAMIFHAACTRELRIADEPWLELESEHFLLRTDVDEATARATIADLERVRAAFLNALVWGGEPPPPARPFLVVEVQDLAELNQFSRPGMEGFVSVFGLGERIVAMSAEQSPSRQPTLKHELAHAIASLMLRRQPAWFAEGLACFLETTQLQDREGRDLIGEIDEQRVQWLAQHGPMPAAEVFATKSGAQLELKDSYRFESSAYEIFFMLFNQRPGQLAAFMHSLAQGEEPKAAFEQIFPDLTPARIDSLVLDSLQQGAHYTKLAVPLSSYRGKVVSRALHSSEVHAQLAVLFALSPGVVDRDGAQRRAQAEAAMALSLDPGSPEALGVLFALDETTREQRIAAARRSVALHAKSWRAQLLLADALTEDPAAPLSPEEHRAASDERLDAARAAAELAPTEPALLSIYANALASHGHLDEARAIAERAVALDPASPTALSVLAQLLGSAGECAESARLLERAVELTPERAPHAYAAAMQTLQRRIAMGCASDVEAANLQRTLAPNAPQTASAKAMEDGDGGMRSGEGALRSADNPAPEHDAKTPIDRVPTLVSCVAPGPAIQRPDPRASSSTGPSAAATLSAEVRYLVGDDGRVKKVERVSGSDALVMAIRKWLSTCTYEPGRRGGYPINAQVQEVFSFAVR